MRLNLYLRGIDLVDLELHIGSKGLYVDLSVFQPRDGMTAPDGEAVTSTADLSGTAQGSYERADGPLYGDDQPVDVRAQGFGFGGQSSGR